MLELIKHIWNDKSRTTIMGYVKMAIGLIALGTVNIDFLPPNWIKPVVSVCAFLYLVGVAVGGNVQAANNDIKSSSMKKEETK